MKHVLISEVISSAPALPLPASFSDSAVNPEMSADSIEPSTLVHDGDGLRPSSTASLGTNAVSASWLSLDSMGVSIALAAPGTSSAKGSRTGPRPIVPQAFS